MKAQNSKAYSLSLDKNVFEDCINAMDSWDADTINAINEMAFKLQRQNGIAEKDMVVLCDELRNFFEKRLKEINKEIESVNKDIESTDKDIESVNKDIGSTDKDNNSVVEYDPELDVKPKIDPDFAKYFDKDGVLDLSQFCTSKEIDLYVEEHKEEYPYTHAYNLWVKEYGYVFEILDNMYWYGSGDSFVLNLLCHI